MFVSVCDLHQVACVRVFVCVRARAHLNIQACFHVAHMHVHMLTSVSRSQEQKKNASARVLYRNKKIRLCTAEVKPVISLTIFPAVPKQHLPHSGVG